MADTPDGRAVHDVVARAAGLRDRFVRRRRAWRAAPWLAAFCLLIAAAGRLIGWPPAFALACGTGLGGLLAAYALLPRRPRDVHDGDAAALDDRAALGGELRSAHWFAAQQDAGAWVTYHLARAADRIRTAPWTELYAPQRMPRTYAVTAVLAVTAAIVAFVGPTTGAARAPGVRADRAGAPGRTLTAAEIERQLAALLATLESGGPATGRPVSADDIRALLDAVRESQRQNAGRPGATIDDDLHERLDRASQMASLDPEVRGALEDLKKALSASKPENAKSEKAAGAPTEKGGAPQGDAAQTNQAGGQDAATAQMLSDSQPGAGYGVVGMTNEAGAPPRDAGLGMGGGDGGSPNSGVMVELGAALRRETLESGAGESAGDPATDLRHKTDRGKASVAFSRGAAAAAGREPGNAVAVIPEARRPAARAYFQRKR